MAFLRILARERKIQTAAVLAIVAVVASRFVLGSEAAVETVVRGGYWVLVFVFGYFCVLAGRAVREAWRARPAGAPARWLLGGVLLASAVLLVHERYGYKILADEVLLSGTAMSMHYERKVAYPLRATDVQGPFQILQNALDKRPFLYPFLVSIVHDVTGYRVQNAFYVNTVLGIAFLALLAGLGWKLGGTPWAGALVLLLFAGLPLLAQQMKGGGFDLLNLTMLAVVLWLGIRFAEGPSEESLAALAFAAVLLAFARYESILMLVPVAGLIVTVWWRERRVAMNWATAVVPLALLFPLLQNRVFAVKAGAWELASRPEATTPFGLHYVPNNLGHALGFFFDTTGYQPNSPVFGALGLVASAFFLLWILRSLRRPDATPAAIATSWIGLGYLGLAAVLMLYFWGQIDDPVIRRLSLPLHLLMAVAIAAVGGSVLRRARGWQFACAAAAAALIVHNLPVMSRRAYALTYSPAAEMEWRTDFLHRFPDRDYLFIDNDSVFWIAHRIPATPNTQAGERKEGLAYHLRNRSFSAVYVMQHYRLNPDTGERTLVPSDDLGPDFKLEPVWEKRIQTLFLGRISRVVSITHGGETIRASPPIPPLPSTATPLRSGADWDAAKKAYTDRWLKQLP